MPCSSVKECICKKVECANHSKCCACVANHREKGNLPVCLRQENKTKPKEE